MKKIKKEISGKLLRLIIIPFILCVLGISLSLFFSNRISFSVLEYEHKNSIASDIKNKKLLEGDVVVGEFTSRENHLGIISIRFKDFIKPDFRGEDVLQFRIKEKGAENWHYLNNYRSGLLKDQLIYPFGFPTIAHSLDKTYVFELESLLGNEVNGVQLSDRTVYSAHQIPRAYIIGSKMNTANFLTEKFITSFTSFDFILSSLIYFLPLFFYLLWQFLLLKFSISKVALSTLVIMLIGLNILLVKEYYLGVYIGLLVLWLITIRIYRLESSVSLIFFSLLFSIWFLLNMIGIRSFDNKLNIWAFTFLVLSIIQIVIEHKYPKDKRVGYREYILRVIKFK